MTMTTLYEVFMTLPDGSVRIHGRYRTLDAATRVIHEVLWAAAIRVVTA